MMNDVVDAMCGNELSAPPVEPTEIVAASVRIDTPGGVAGAAAPAQRSWWVRKAEANSGYT